MAKPLSACYNSNFLLRIGIIGSVVLIRHICLILLRVIVVAEEGCVVVVIVEFVIRAQDGEAPYEAAARVFR